MTAFSPLLRAPSPGNLLNSGNYITSSHIIDLSHLLPHTASRWPCDQCWDAFIFRAAPTDSFGAHGPGSLNRPPIVRVYSPVRIRIYPPAIEEMRSMLGRLRGRFGQHRPPAVANNDQKGAPVSVDLENHGANPNAQSQLVLPVEIWLDIFKLLSTHSLCSLAQCCSSLYLLAHTKAPFRSVSFQRGGRGAVKDKCRHPSFLRFAVVANWESSGGSPRRTSADTLSSDARALRIVLSSLPRSTSLRFLSLTDIDIAVAQQITIFSLPRLRTLKLHASHMLPTNKPLPASQITHLILNNPAAGPPTLHLLRHIASGLETFELKAPYPINVEVLAGFQTGEARLLNLSRFVYNWWCRNGSLDTLSIWQCVGQYTSITSLEVSTTSGILWSQPDATILPKLRDLSCDLIIANMLVPGRPVVNYRQLVGYALMDLHDPALLIASLAMSQAGIRRARTLIHHSLAGYLHDVASQLPLLEVLDVFVEDNWIGHQHHAPHVNYPAEMEGSAISSLAREWAQSPANDGSLHRFPSLRDVRVYAKRPSRTNTDYVLHEQCRVLFETCFLPICPVLETFECRAVLFPAAMVEGEEVPQEWQWKIKRNGNGEWEKQVEPPQLLLPL